MIVSGHAHGGQWRVFGRGVYAPDQHLFPKYTSGVHEGRLVISRGVANTVSPIPRFFNRREGVVVSVGE
jgi:predicted MPP superfamily phosphohydrolase